MAGWPSDRWVAWRRRVATILAEADAAIAPEDQVDAPRPDADEIMAADRRAFDEMTSPCPFTGKASNFVVRATN